MEIELFDQAEIEFFELSARTPEAGEGVVIVLKPGVHDGGYTGWNHVTGQAAHPRVTSKVTVDFATFYVYKTRPNKFICTTKYKSRTFYEKDIICWGRAK